VLTFKQFCVEQNIAGAGGVFGDGPSFDHGGAVGNIDFYAPGDSRIPYAIGLFRRSGIVKRKRKKKKSRRKSRKSKKKS
jgi:hypothetical protein